ncbi:hypothetical protein [Streptomyces sp. Z26]|uniref:hypothetical protein n=1 Tax=Streptomyces sp. Z26 TaxID=2500177 RepID=UPI000EF172CF|nr:hypothetical protein [Streptomyces sp. Z26]RLL67504.1 hypothetical protein D7M15_12295 [Streptomyces sp. Z26]
MRDVQGTLDDAQATRSRTLAALAVTVRNDGAVADLLGLTEREVRVARRTVGKEDARAVADELLAAPLPPLPTAPAAEEPYADEGGAEGTAYVPPPPQQAPPPPPPPSAPPQVTVVGATGGGAGGPGGEPVWSAAMDAVLVGGWQTGVDLQVLATEFGLDLPRLVSRAQQLSVQGRLGPHRAGYGQEETGGRHRRGAGAGTGATRADTCTIPAQQTSSAWDATVAADQAAWGTGGHQGWGQEHGQGPAAQEYGSGQAYAGETATATHDWDGILHEWGDTPAVREGAAAAYQQAYQPT